MATKKSTKASDALLAEIRAIGLAYPGAHSKSPWPGHDDLAVNDKTFAYLSRPGEPFGISCKLPHTNAIALTLPNTKPAEYGLGKSGWVSASFPDQLPPIEMLKAWLDESYRAQAPKRLVKQLDGGPSRISVVIGGEAATGAAKGKAAVKPKAKAKAKARVRTAR